MLHTKFHGNGPAGSGEEDFLKGFYHMSPELTKGSFGHFGSFM